MREGVLADEAHISIPDVRAVGRGVALVCEIGGRRVAVPFNAIAPTSRVQKPGDIGTLVIAVSVARRIGITATSSHR